MRRANCPAVCGTFYGLADDRFHAETNSCDICGAQHAAVSFAEYSGTAVSRFSTEFAPGERDANEREPARRTRTNWSALDDFRGRLLEGQVTPLAGWSGCAVVLCARKRTRYAHSEFC